MVERLVIDRIGHRGEGIAEVAGGPVFVPYVLPGESVEVEQVAGQATRRQLVRVAAPSPDRVAPVCPHFAVCGGCALQHWRGEKYRAWKRDLLVQALAYEKLEAPIAELVDAHGEGRRRAVFHARRSQRGVLNVGFAALRAHHIVPIDRCPIFAPGLDRAIPAAWALAEALSQQTKPLDIQVTATAAGLDVDLRGSGPLRPEMSARLARTADTHDLARLTRHGELIALRRPPTIRMGRAEVPLPPGGFLQATAAGEEILARLVSEQVGKARRIADLFCGVGPFALRLAAQAQVTAADNDAAAIGALRQAAATSGLKPIDPQPRDLFRRPYVAAELARIDAVVLDPPRQGAEAQARELAASRVPLVVSVSCNPATFARDARILVDGGYRLVGATPVDQFRYAAHVEIVGCFTRP